MSQWINKPDAYVVCTAAEGNCPLRETCLRSKAFRETDHTSATGNRQLTVVNLWNSSVKPQTEDCAMYREARLRPFARGFRHLFDAVPRGIYQTVQQQVQHIFGNRRYYFFCKKGQRLTSPEEQAAIARVFEKNGLTAAPKYDEIVNAYDFSE